MHRWLRRLVAFVLCLSLLLSVMEVDAVEAERGERCFPETSFCISGRIREFWERNGGLPVFGFPVASQYEAQVEGRPFQAQWFERARLELHPENARPYDVLLGRLGVDRLMQQGRDWFQFPRSAPQTGCRFFLETGHNVCGAFLRDWHANGLELDGRRGKTEAESLALFGLPVSDAHAETVGDTELTVQWFERGRFELHPANVPPYDVLLGLLGNEVRAPAEAVPAPASDPCADVPELVSAAVQPGTCINQGQAITIDVFGFQPDERVASWLTAPDGKIVRTDEAHANSTGGIGGVGFETRDLFPGLWFWVFQGIASKHSAIVYFKVLGNGAPPLAAPLPAAPPPSGNYHINWGGPELVGPTNMRSFTPSAVVDSNNHTHIVYQADDGAIWYTNNIAGSFAPPQVVQPNLGRDLSLLFSIGLGPNNTLHLVYSWISRDKQIYYRQASLDGVTARWSGPEQIGDLGDKAVEPSVVVDGEGNAHIAWSAHCRAGSLTYNVYYRVRRPDGSLSKTAPIRDKCDVMERRALLALTEDGTVHAVFTYGDEVAYARREGDGWASRNISESSGIISKDDTVTTDGRAIYVAWNEDVNGHHVLFRRSSDGGRTWSKIEMISDSHGLARFPSAAYSATSRRVYIAYVDLTASKQGQTDIWYRGFDPGSGEMTGPDRLTQLSGGSLVPSFRVGPSSVALIWQGKPDGLWQVFHLGGALVHD